MITDAVLREAVGKGLLTAGQAEALRSLARQNGVEPPPRREPVDEEKLRFVSGFADIFVTLGVALFLSSAGYLVASHVGDAAATVAGAALAWGLAEVFTRRKRMALPSIVLLIAFATSVFAASSALLPQGQALGPSRFGWLGSWLSLGHRDPWSDAAASLVTAILVGVHFWRFRVPITVAAGTASLLLAFVMVLYAVEPAFVMAAIEPILLAAGLVAFTLAMRFDLSDPERRTRATDIAFWLHLLAAPLIVHSVFSGLGVVRAGSVEPGNAVAILTVFLGLGVVAVLVDRRALLVSGLVYAGLALGSLIGRAGLGGTSVPLTLLALGAFVLALSAGWAPLRSAALRRLPDGLASRLPRPLAT